MKQFLVKIMYSILVVFAPAKEMLLAAMLLILVDLVTGVLAAHKRKDKITSAGFQRTIVKLMVYEVAIALAFITQHYLLEDSIPTAKIVAGFIGLTELKSTLENMDTISGKPLLKSIINKLGSKN